MTQPSQSTVMARDAGARVDVALSSHPLKAVKQDLLIHHLCHEIALPPLQETEVAEYLAAEWGGAAVPEGLAELIYERSEGNPLFMVAVLQHMRERKFITQERGVVRLTLELPEDYGLSGSLGFGCDPQWIEVCCSTGSSGIVRWHRPPLLTFNGPRATFFRTCTVSQHEALLEK